MTRTTATTLTIDLDDMDRALPRIPSFREPHAPHAIHIRSSSPLDATEALDDLLASIERNGYERADVSSNTMQRMLRDNVLLTSLPLPTQRIDEVYLLDMDLLLDLPWSTLEARQNVLRVSKNLDAASIAHGWALGNSASLLCSRKDIPRAREILGVTSSDDGR
ncbi:MAG: hypothetical protein KDC95_23740 [Planctomycetes bacterium]|nr:hypothetical protein [Planctomycetota bacterium]